ncbi:MULTISPECIES: ATP-binding protein [unclassified Microbacterium]|uniref:ATP-binding protein n=1 Tax=unclassified Microbacterium TaxID=2609290 RepID=UPI001E5BE53A|nr:ATP-binding protein [Microbacterium sp. Au-Mic1]MCE4026185.1 ATP-binding protein [Microbacterium sp. Au-Mic1]
MQNPFRPTAGATPPIIVSREGLLKEFEYGLRVGSGAPGLLTIFTGARGVGKTVMLGAAEDLARTRGWVVISETATPGFMARIGETMRTAEAELGDGPTGRRITGVTVAGFGVTTQLAPQQQIGWRELGQRLLTLLAQQRTGLLITVDEIHAAERTEIATLAASIQHFIRDGLPIALIFAGLPAAVSDLLNEGVATFLRRADRIDLHSASIEETAQSFADLFAQGGHPITPELARTAAEGTGGYPFLIQLVGYSLWQEAESREAPIDADAVREAVAAARRRNEQTVIGAALSTVSARDMDFLLAMTVDDAISDVGDIGRRMAATPSLVGKYRARLIDAGLIESVGYGRVAFAIPGLREYLRAQTGR